MGTVTYKTFETICCICQRRKGSEGWEKVPVKSRASLSHGLCPECYRKTMIKYGLTSPLDRLPGYHQREVLS